MSHPIALTLDDDQRRSRVTVFFRLILVIPHLIWATLWGIVVAIAILLSWFATLFMGRTPRALHDFIAQYLRYSTHLYGYLGFLANPYPGFLGNSDYPVDLVVAEPARQNRWKTFFRVILILPAHLVNSMLGYVVLMVSIMAWIVCVITGSMPLGLRDLTTWIARFNVQIAGYVWLLTDRYPNFSPDLLE